MQPTFTAGVPRFLFARLHCGFDVTAEGKKFLVIREAAQSQPPAVVVVQNWFAEFLRK